MTTTSEGKVCPTCQEWLVLDSFCKDKRRLTGRHVQCRKCRGKHKRKRYLKTKKAGLCVACSKSRGADGSSTLCGVCLEEQRDRMQDRRWAAK